MIPDCLEAFKEPLKKFRKKSIQINARPLRSRLTDDPLSFTKSKFLGKPFVPIDQPYPQDQEGRPMILLAQINFAEMGYLESFPSDGLLQIFISPMTWDIQANGVKIIYQSKALLNKPHLNDFSFIKESDYRSAPIAKIHTLDFFEDIEFGTPIDSEFDMNFGGESYREFVKALDGDAQDELSYYFECSGHKLGGYAEFAQNDPRVLQCAKNRDVHLLQIDSQGEVMFGNNGLAHVFIDPVSLATRDFSDAYFYWDSY